MSLLACLLALYWAPCQSITLPHARDSLSSLGKHSSEPPGLPSGSPSGSFSIHHFYHEDCILLSLLACLLALSWVSCQSISLPSCKDCSSKIWLAVLRAFWPALFPGLFMNLSHCKLVSFSRQAPSCFSLVPPLFVLAFHAKPPEPIAE